MRKLDIGLKDVNKSGLDFGMDESYSDFLSKKISKTFKERKAETQVLRGKLRKAETQADDKKVISLSKRIEKLDMLSKIPNKEIYGKQGKKILLKKVAEKMAEKTCVERLKTMKLTQEGMEDYIKKCEENGDFSASKFYKQEEVAVALLKNDIVKLERADARINDEIKATEDAVKESQKPEVQKEGFSKKILPIMAICGIVFLMIKKF